MRSAARPPAAARWGGPRSCAGLPGQAGRTGSRAARGAQLCGPLLSAHHPSPALSAWGSARLPLRSPTWGPSPLSGWGARPAADGPEPCPGPQGGAAGAGSLLPWGWRPPFGVRARNKCCGSGGAAPRGPTQMVNLSDGARLLGSPLLLPDAARLKPRRSESNDPGDLCGRSNLQLYFETNLFFFL